MPRLIDDLRAAGRMTMPSWIVAGSKEVMWAQHAGRIWEILQDPGIPVIKMDNVSDFYFTGSDQEFWDLSKDFPNLAPPYPLAWYEHRMPSKIHSTEKGDTDVAQWVPRGRVGVLMFGSTRENIQGVNVPDNLHWALTSEVFIDYGSSHGGIQGPHGSIHIAVDKDGQIIDRPFMTTFCRDEDQEMAKDLITWLHPALLTICFLHCKNVTVIDEQVPKPLAKKYHNKTGSWPVRYKTLEIRPLKEILRREGKSESLGLKRALHICRGHFRDYRQGKGLFGKYHQLVWTPAIVRGGTKDDKPPARDIEVKL